MTTIKNIAILGGGESGHGAAILAAQVGLDVFLSDAGLLKSEVKADLEERGISYEEGKHSEDKILGADIVVKSPGIPDDVPLVVKIRENDIEVISEIEFAFRKCKSKVIAVTGSNGKTTTASLIYHILKKSGLSVALGGNIGKSFARLVAENQFDWYVLELSSFQLDGIKVFKPDIAVLLNVTPDHLDRYDNDFDKYLRSKFRITENQHEQDTFIFNYDDQAIKKYLENNTVEAKRLPFSIDNILDEGAWLENESINININHNSLTMSIHELALQGKHNIYNSMAAGIAGRVLDLKKELIRESLADFQNIEHRLEFVMAVHGINFINDSKATNINSAWYALESLDAGVIWIAGGVDKGNDYSQLNELVAEKVKAIICIGEDNRKIHKAFDDIIEYIEDAENMNDAVRQSYKFGEKGDTVLLAPACASFDRFENFEERGHAFKQAVRLL